MDILDRLKEQAQWHSDGHGPLHAEAAAEITRLRARPTEEEVARAVSDTWYCTSSEGAKVIARAVLALFPKVQP